MVSAHGDSEVFAPGLLSGQAALVTGGGTGLGKATALELARCTLDDAVCGENPPLPDKSVISAYYTRAIRGCRRVLRGR